MHDSVPDVLVQLVEPSLTLRRFRTSDAPMLLSALDEARPELQRWSGLGQHDATLQEVEERLMKMRAAFDEQKRLAYAIIDGEGRLSGSCALERIDWRARTFQLGYWLRPSAQGRGLATSAVAALTRHAFADLAAIRVSIWVDEKNGRSAMVAQRLGFLLEARLRNERLNAEGNPQNTLIFARTGADGL